MSLPTRTNGSAGVNLRLERLHCNCLGSAALPVPPESPEGATNCPPKGRVSTWEPEVNATLEVRWLAKRSIPIIDTRHLVTEDPRDPTLGDAELTWEPIAD